MSDCRAMKPECQRMGYLAPKWRKAQGTALHSVLPISSLLSMMAVRNPSSELSSQWRRQDS